MKKNDFGMLTFDQVKMHKLEIFKQTLKAEQTDLATLFGGNNTYDISGYGHSKKNNSATWVTEDGAIYNDATWSEYDDGYYHEYGGVRPVISFNKIAHGVRNRHINEDGILEVEYGYFPQTILKRVDLSNGYEWDNFGFNEYMISDGLELSEWFNRYDHYIVLNSRYLEGRPKVSKHLSDCREFGIDTIYYIKIEPIKWLVDTKTGLAVSKYILAYMKTSYFNAFFEDFEKEITQRHVIMPKLDSTSKRAKTENINATTNQATKILDEIYKYAVYYHGKTDIMQKKDELIEVYNEKIKEASGNSSFELTFENNNLDYLKQKLLSDLNDILDALKHNYENNEVYYDILDSVDRCLAIIDNDKRGATSELEKDLQTISSVIIPYLANDDNKQKLKDIFLEIKKYILELLESIPNIGDKVNGKYNSFNDYEMDVRSKLETFLLSIYPSIVTVSLVDSIVDDWKSIIHHNYKEAKSVIVRAYLNEMNELVTYIRNYGTKEEITTLNESISFVDVDYADLNHTSDNLVNVIRKLYRIKLDIEARKKLNQKIKDYTVYLPKIKAKEK